jgi:hypothetical protein
MTLAVSIAQSGANNVTMRNRIINGAMMIDQRNAGASFTPTAASYSLDRWNTNLSQASKYSVQQNAGSVTPPAGYTNYLGVTSLSAYSVGSTELFSILQSIEGFNVADFGWGTANAQPVTLSFWVRSSLTGTFGGSFNNSNFSRSYPYSYTINSANTWEYKTITVLGDTTGTWLTNNSTGLHVYFNLGAGSARSNTAGAWVGSLAVAPTGAVSVVGTNGATFYITGVQLEEGTTATAFEQRLYGTELALCQRYLPAWTAEATADRGNLIGQVFNSTTVLNTITFPVTARVPPTGLTTTGAFNQYNASLGGLSVSATTFNNGSVGGASFTCGVGGGLVAGNASLFQATGSAGASRIIFTGCEL